MRPYPTPMDETQNGGERVAMSRHAGDFDVVILGGTPGGLAAAIAAARLGRSVALVEYQAHLGGMSASGLGKSDIERREMVGGLFREFIQRVYETYVARYGAGSDELEKCRHGYYYEPSVAESVFSQMVRQAGSIRTWLAHRLVDATVEDGGLRAVSIAARPEGDPLLLTARTFVDATYEGDLLAAAGAGYRSGREGRDAFDEPHAGMIYFDYERGRTLPGSTGQADHRLPAYTYRLCLTTDVGKGRAIDRPPPGYDPQHYLGYHDDLAAGRLAPPRQFKPGRGYYPEHFNTLVRALSVTDLPGGKVDANINPRPLSFPFSEENEGYVDGDWQTREAIADRHRQLTLGLLWFLQNDPSVPAAHREMARRYRLPADEFPDNDHFPWQLYVREARRLQGLYTLTEHDITRDNGRRSPAADDDTIAIGEFPIDSFPVRKRQPGDSIVLEGYLGMLDGISHPYPIPYRVMLPEQLDALIVPVAVSATHIAYSSVRMEPTWMALGQAAGVATHLAITRQTPLRDIPIPALQDLLRHQGQVL